MVLYLGTRGWILSTNGECSKSLFIPALVSEGHKKLCLASLLRHLCAVTPLKGKSIRVFSPAVILERPSIPTWGIHALLFTLKFWELSTERKKYNRASFVYPWVLWLMARFCLSLLRSKSRFSEWLSLSNPQDHESTAPPIGVCRISHKNRLTALMRSSLMPEVSVTFYLHILSWLQGQNRNSQKTLKQHIHLMPYTDVIIVRSTGALMMGQVIL